MLSVHAISKYQLTGADMWGQTCGVRHARDKVSVCIGCGCVCV